MLTKMEKLNILSEYRKGDINLITVYMVLFLDFDGFVCRNSRCRKCGDTIIPQDKQKSMNRCNYCI